MPLAETANLIVNMNLKGDFRKGMAGAQKDLRGFTTQANQTTGRLGRLQSKLKSPELRSGLLQGVGLSGGLIGFQLLGTAVNGAVNYMGSALGAASDLTESMSKVDEVFEDSAPNVRRWASEIDASFGISERAALESAGTLGNFLTALGQTESAAADMSTSIVELAGDLSSFNNVASEDVLVALQAGLAGETEPVRRLGIDISAARVESLLLAEGIQKVNGEFTQSQKTLGRYLAIMQDTEKAQGDAARTADTLAGRQRQLDANLGNLESTIGKLIEQPATDLSGFFVQAAEGALSLAEAIPDLQGNLQGLQDDLTAIVGRDLVNDLANLGRIGSTGGLILIPDAIGDIQDETTGLGKAVEDLVGESTDLGRVWDDLFGGDTLIGGSLQDLADDITGVERRYDPLSSIVVDTTRAFEEQAEAVEDTARAYDPLSSITTATARRMNELAEAAKAARREFNEFRENADEIAETRSLGKINEEIDEQKRLRRQAARAGNVAAFAAAQAALDQLRQERELRKQGRASLKAFQDRTGKQKTAQEGVTQKVRGTTQALQTLDKTRANPRVTVNTAQAHNAIARVRSSLQNLTTGEHVVNIGGQNFGAIGGRARGGPVQAGRAYIVGEHRPEVFVPNQNGRIVPNVPTSMGGVEVYVTPYLTVAASQVEGNTTKVVRTNRFREKNQ